jgi:hypothetical protein
MTEIEKLSKMSVLSSALTLLVAQEYFPAFIGGISFESYSISITALGIPYTMELFGLLDS